MNEKLFMFNPFRIKEITNAQLQELYNDIFSKLIDDPQTIFQYSHNVEIYTNLMYICGECIARFTREIIDLKTKIQIDTAINQTEERKNWDTEKLGKAPAMNFFEARAIQLSQEDIKKLADKECFLKRFKNAYETLESKCNAIKKKIEAVKFEEGLN